MADTRLCQGRHSAFQAQGCGCQLEARANETQGRRREEPTRSSSAPVTSSGPPAHLGSEGQSCGPPPASEPLPNPPSAAVSAHTLPTQNGHHVACALQDKARALGTVPRRHPLLPTGPQFLLLQPRPHRCTGTRIMLMYKHAHAQVHTCVRGHRHTERERIPSSRSACSHCSGPQPCLGSRGPALTAKPATSHRTFFRSRFARL